MKPRSSSKSAACGSSSPRRKHRSPEVPGVLPSASRPLASLAMPTLHTERLLLDAFTLEDAAVMHRLAGDPKWLARQRTSHTHTTRRTRKRGWSHHRCIRRKVTLPSPFDGPDDSLVGAISLGVDTTHQHAEAGYWIGRTFCGQGYATEALQKLVSCRFAG